MRSAAERRLVRSTRGARAHVAATVVLGAAGAALTVAQAAALARIVDRTFLHGAGLSELRGPVLVLAATALGRAAVAWATEVSGRIGAVRAMSELRRRAVARLLLDRPGALAGERTGELAGTAVAGVDALEAWFARYLPQVALAAIVPLGILGFLFTQDPRSTLVLAVTVPLVPVFMVLVGKGAEAATKKRFATLQLLGAHFLDVVRGLPTLRAFRREAAQEETIARVGERLRRETMATLRIAFLSALVLELCAMLGTAVAAGTVGVQLASGTLTLQAGLTVLILAPELYAPLRQLGIAYHAGVDGIVAAERLFELADAPRAIARPRRPEPLPDPAREPVRLEGVSFAYPARDGSGDGWGRDAAPADGIRDTADGARSRGPAVLDRLDLALAPGQTTALVGPSGAGKSTIAALVLRLADPTAGCVTCGGVDLRAGDPEAWWSRVAWVPQRTRIFAGTVADNVRLGDPDADDRAVREALAAAGALGFVGALPEGASTVVGEGGRRLSAGEAQRIALARAFVRDASLVVLDEPTAHLDPDTAHEVGEAIAALCRGRTALVVTHDPALAALADRVVEIDDGRIAPRLVAVAPPVLGAARGRAA